MPKKKQEKSISEAVQQKLAGVEKLFRDLENDKSLPTFGEHFMHCLMFGVAENVDLKKMYPETYRRLSKWLDDHNKAIQDFHKR